MIARILKALLVLLVLGLCAAVVPAQELQFEDTEARIDYAWFTEDANQLRNSIQSLRAQAQKTADTPAANYLIALASYRLGALLAPKTPEAAATSTTHCVEHAARAAETTSSTPAPLSIASPEALALQSICYTVLAQLQGWKSMVNAPLAAIKMEKAQKLAPNNPRVALLAALRDFFQAKPTERGQTLPKFRRALELYEANGQKPAAGLVPNWGYAETYWYLGQGLRESGDLLGARNAYERALIIAPDFAAARRELQDLLRQ